MSNRPGGFVITKDSKIIHFPPSRENYSSFYQQRVETDTKDQVPSNWAFAYWGDDYHDSFHCKETDDINELRSATKDLVRDVLLDVLSTISDPFVLTDDNDNEDELFILQFPCEYTTFEYSIPYWSEC